MSFSLAFTIPILVCGYMVSIRAWKYWVRLLLRYMYFYICKNFCSKICEYRLWSRSPRYIACHIKYLPTFYLVKTLYPSYTVRSFKQNNSYLFLVVYKTNIINPHPLVAGTYINIAIIFFQQHMCPIFLLGNACHCQTSEGIILRKSKCRLKIQILICVFFFTIEKWQSPID